MKTRHLQLTNSRSLILLIILFATASVSFAQDWSYVTNNEGKFKAIFPTKPEINREETEKGISNKLTSSYNYQTCMVTYKVHTTKMVGHEELADVSLNAFNDKLGGTILSEKKWKVGGNTGKQATISIEDKGATVHYKVVLVDQIQYQLVYFAPDENVDKKISKKFFSGFKLL